MTNRLSSESSPYLRQHAGNPVDWYPWGPEALEKARSENKPIFLSIGYAACHWCHVMERESFEDHRTAELLNRHFVSIKVDREERPDLDAIYMQAVMAMTGQGGWPMSVWLTPQQVPFYGGTYFPPEPRHGLPSFRQILQSLSQAWETRRDTIDGTASRLVELLAPQVPSAPAGGEGGIAAEEFTRQVLEVLHSSFDREHGGWGGAPKFPPAMVLEYLVRLVARDEAAAAQMASQTLDAMCQGGIYDQLGGGFHRYATDSRWLVPHFEKMLYDNAQLARVYLHGYQLTGNPVWREVTRSTLDYLLREMTHPAGGFFSSQDADSEGVEGKFFVWDDAEIRELLGADHQLFAAVYGVSTGGNWEGRNILHLRRSLAEAAVRFDVAPEELDHAMARARAALLARREQRVRPPRDEKVVVAWNGMALAAFAEAGRFLRDPRYLEAARANGDFLLETLRDGQGRLLRTWHDGFGARHNAYLEDYVNLVEGLLALYQATFEDRWFEAARELTEFFIERFAAADWFYDTSDDHERLVVRPRDLFDNAVPSGNAMAATVLAKMAALSGETAWSERSRIMSEGMAPVIVRQPTAFGQWLQAYEWTRLPPLELALVGDPGDSELERMRQVVDGTFRPRVIMAAGSIDQESSVPLLSGRTAPPDGAAAYLCQGFVCHQPAYSAEALEVQLQDSTAS